jgi:hypothetical protein
MVFLSSVSYPILVTSNTTTIQVSAVDVEMRNVQMDSKELTVPKE